MRSSPITTSPRPQDLLLHPDHRLLPLLAPLTRPRRPAPPAPAVVPSPAAARTLPDLSLALTVVPCAVEQTSDAPFG